MTSKEKLFALLATPPTTIGTGTFPTLTVPDAPSTVEGAILCNANCSRQIITWLNAYQGMSIQELYGMVGMLSPAAQAIAAGFLQADGTDISAAESLEAAIKLIGDDASGGGLTGNIESIARRTASGGTLSLLASAIASIPALADYSDFLSPIISVALAIYEKPGRIGEQVAYILLDNICTLIKEIIINELYPAEKPEGSPPLESETLKLIADRLRTLDSSGEEADVPLGSLLQAINQRLSVTKADGVAGEAQFPAGTRSEIIEREDTLGGRIDKLLSYFLPNTTDDVPSLGLIVESLRAYDNEGEWRQETIGDMLYDINQKLRCTDVNGDEVDIPLGSMLQALQKRFAIRKAGEPRGQIDFPEGTREAEQEEPDLAGDALEMAGIGASQDEAVEIDGTRIWFRSKHIDS